MAKDEDEIIDELNADSPKRNPEEDEDKVTAAYESINKRLEGLKKGNDSDEEEDDEEEENGKEGEESEEVRGGKMDKDVGSEKKEEEESEEPGDILDKEDDDSEESNESDESKDDEEEVDSLDDVEDNEGSKGSKETEESEDEKVEGESGKMNEEGGDEKEDSGKAAKDEPDTLDDLTKEDSGDLDAKEYNRPTRRFDKEESDLDIPNLRRPMNENSFGESKYSEEPKPNPFSSRMDHRNDFGTYGPKKSGNKIHLLILILIGLAVIGGTVYLLKSQFESTPAEPSPSPIAIETSTPEPTPSFDRAQYKLRVLNGTSTSGLAGSVSAKLKELGYQIDKTGNAPNQNFKKAQIKVKTSATGLSEQLLKDLPSEYQDASAAGELKDTDAADAEIILGAD